MSTPEHILKILAAETTRPLKDAAGIIIPASVDAHHQAAGMRRIIQAMEADCEAHERATAHGRPGATAIHT